ncbi:MAG: RCC1 domain-containing protein [Ilumatobacter sp.]|uniref:RCC1 domain-containing protein n=1 Tax=Ilumatobacter sp. TaxID=1967498 RepID=UPI003919E4C0
MHQQFAPRRNVLVAFVLVVTAVVATLTVATSSPASASTAGAVDVSFRYTCAVMADTTVQCWGLDVSGKLGTSPSTGEARPTPTTVPGVIDARSLALGEEHACALLGNGTVTCWGANDYAQLGRGTTGGTEFAPGIVPGLANVVQITSGGYHTCAVINDGTISCWGDNNEGKVGIDPASSSVVSSPTAVAGVVDVVEASTSLGNTCALDGGGDAYCWGDGDEGALGNGTNDSSFVPLLVPFSGPVADVAAGDLYLCAALQSGTVECVGDGSDGQLGDGNATQSYTIVEVVDIDTAVQLALGYSTACARLADGSIQCWGEGQRGRLGNGVDSGDNVEQPTPVDVEGIDDAVEIVGHADHHCVLRATGAVSCWGDASGGQLATDTPEFATRARLVPGTAGQPIAEVSVGFGFTCFRTVGGGVGCVGDNSRLQLATPGVSSADTATPIPGLTTAAQIESGGEHTCVRLSDSTIQCWGEGAFGRLGNGTSTDFDVPTTVRDDTDSGPLTDIDQVSGGEDHSCAVTGAGLAWCWGRGSDGRLGHGLSPTSQTLPVAVTGLTDASAIAAGGRHSCAVDTAGDVQCWGDNGQRQLGTGGVIDATTPVDVISVTDVTQLSAGDSHTCGATTAGAVWCWGADGSGALGDGALTATEPVMMTGVTTASHVTAGRDVTCVLLDDETVRCAGSNGRGELGDGTTESRDVAVSVIDESGAALSGIGAIAADRHVCTVRKPIAGGGVYCWGENRDGQLGFFPWSSTPVTAPLSMSVGATTTTTTTTSPTTTITTTTTTTTTVPVAPPTTADLFTAVAPARLVESRIGDTLQTIDGEQEGIGRLDGGDEITVEVAGRAGVDDDAVAAIVNVTAIRPGGPGFVTTHPCLDDRPTTSSLNYSAGVSLGNEVIVELDASGNACLFTSNATDVAVDIVGFLPAGSPYVAVGPARLADTRTVSAAETVDGQFLGDGTVPAGGTYRVQITERAGIPDGADAAVVNVTAIRASGVGFFTIHPCLATPPTAASLNYTATANRGNEIIAPASADGEICVFTSASTDLAIDVVGYIDAPAYRPIAPARLLETRVGPGLDTVDGNAEGIGKLGADTETKLRVGGRNGIPADASTVTINVTAIQAEAVGFITIHPCLGQPPTAASLNYVPGVNGGNEIIAQLDTNGDLCIYTSATTHLTIDIAGHT